MEKLENENLKEGKEMKILVIDPIVRENGLLENRQFFKEIARPGTLFDIVSLEKGPRSIETEYDVFYAAPEILRRIKKNKDDYDAVMINCFDDPALYAAREISDIPILGAGETSMLVACLLGHKFSVISVLQNMPPRIAIKARSIGIESRLASAYGIEVPVLQLHENPRLTAETILATAKQAVKKDKAEVIVLGCTGIAPVAKLLCEKLEVPLIEPASTTFKMAELMVDLGLKHSRAALYMYPSYDKVRGYE